jgi:ribose 5-phosphate isomerase B
MIERFFIACDHAGFPLKEDLKRMRPEIEWVDLGTDSTNSVDYPDFGAKLACEIKSESDFGVLICGSGVGISIAANRFPHIRAVLAQTEEVARLARQHNHANVLCLGARTTPPDVAQKILEAFQKTKPDTADRHIARIHKLTALK